MRAPERKKQWRKMIKKFTREGFINDASGRMVARNTMKSDNSMIRDYYPQK